MDDALSQYAGHSFKDAIFCAPPSGFDDYPSAVRDAATQLWSGATSGGSFVFTSSGGVYEGADGETVDESPPALDPIANPRQGRMVYAEREVVGLGDALEICRSALVRWCYLNDQPRPAKNGENS